MFLSSNVSYMIEPALHHITDLFVEDKRAVFQDKRAFFNPATELGKPKSKTSVLLPLILTVVFI